MDSRGLDRGRKKDKMKFKRGSERRRKDGKESLDRT